MNADAINKRGLTTVASTLIIIGLVVAIGVVFIIIYNIISSEIEYSTESNISLQIEKSSVVIDKNNKVSLTISRELGDAELEKIKFVLFDGENIEEIEKKASDFAESSEMSFSFTPKLVTNIKTISVVPIIKVAGKRKYLAVANSIEIKKQESGDVIVKTPTQICGNAKLETGEQCDDGNLISGDGCLATCKTENCSTQKGFLCTDEKICSGKTLTSLDTGTCCSVECVVPSSVPASSCGNNVCNGTETCSTCFVDCGVCLPGLKSLGTACSAGNECTSSLCTDGVCCNIACTGSTCKACNVSGSLGTCSNVPAGTDYHSDCTAVPCTDYISGWSGTNCLKYSTTPTSNNGMCNGAGACSSVAQSCTGSGTASASCGSVGCKKTTACVANSLATSYDSVGEICYISGQQGCSSGQACDGTGTCVTTVTCGGTYSGGKCWYIGSASQSCTTVCASHGGSAGVASDDASCTLMKTLRPGSCDTCYASADYGECPAWWSASHWSCCASDTAWEVDNTHINLDRLCACVN